MRCRRLREHRQPIVVGNDSRGDDGIMLLFCPTSQSDLRRGFAFENNGILLCMGLFSRFLVRRWGLPAGNRRLATLFQQAVDGVGRKTVDGSRLAKARVLG
jgi:hypothetical protein